MLLSAIYISWLNKYLENQIARMHQTALKVGTFFSTDLLAL